MPNILYIVLIGALLLVAFSTLTSTLRPPTQVIVVAPPDLGPEVGRPGCGPLLLMGLLVFLLLLFSGGGG